ncbi:MAG: TonB-dependent receptor [Acidobacteria bacterium]|nr:TonB-dependent receptor [Acidobacteriota bacterium]
MPSPLRWIVFSLLGWGLVAQQEPVIQERIQVFQPEEFPFRNADPAPILVFGTDFIQRFNPQTIGDLLRRLPGVSGDADAGEFNRAQLRGLGASYTQILINGQPISSANGDRALWVDQIPIAQIERIELIRSPTAEIPGSGPGGTLNIVLRDKVPFNQTGLNVFSQSGHAKGWASLMVGEQLAQIGYSLLVSQTERYNPKTQTAQHYSEEEGPTSKYETNLFEGRERYYQLGLNSDSAKPSRWTSTLWWLDHRHRENEDARFSADGEVLSDEFDYGRSEQRDWAFESRYAREFGRLHLELMVRHSELKAMEDAELGFFEDGEQEVEESFQQTIHDRRWVGSAHFQLFSGLHQWLWGLGGSYQDRRSTRFTLRDEESELDTFERRENGQNFFVSHQRSTGTFAFNQGLRLEKWKGQEGSDSWVLLPSLHARWTFKPNHQLRVSLARTVRYPEFEALNPFPQRDQPREGVSTYGNPNLRPERAWGLDLGYEHAFQNQQGVLGINLFYRTIHDLVEVSQVDEDLFTYVNQDHGKSYGLELDSGFPLDFWALPQVSLFINATFQKSQLTDPFTGEERPFNGQVQWVANAGFITELEKWSFGLHGLTQGKGREYQATERSRITYGTQLEGFLAWRFKQFELRLTGRNLLRTTRSEQVEIFEESRDSGELLETIADQERSPRSFFISSKLRF